LRRAVREFPDEVFLWTFLGAVLLGSTVSDSEEVLRAAAMRFGDNVAAKSLWHFHSASGSPSAGRGVAFVEEALKADPGNVHALAEKAKILEIGTVREALLISEACAASTLTLRAGSGSAGRPPSGGFRLAETDEVQPPVAEMRSLLGNSMSEPLTTPEDAPRLRDGSGSGDVVSVPGQPFSEPAESRTSPRGRRTTDAPFSRQTKAVGSRRRNQRSAPSRKWARRNEITTNLPHRPNFGASPAVCWRFLSLRPIIQGLCRWADC